MFKDNNQKIKKFLINDDFFKSSLDIIFEQNLADNILIEIIEINDSKKFDLIIDYIKNKNLKINKSSFECIILCQNVYYLKKIIPYVDLNYKNDYYLLYSVENNFFESFKILLPFYKNKEYKNNALIKASLNGNLDMVSILLKNNVNPKYKNNAAIKNAIKYNHNDIVNLLMPYSNLNEVKEFIETLDGSVLNDKYKNSVESYLTHKKIRSQLIDELSNAKEAKKRKM